MKLGVRYHTKLGGVQLEREGYRIKILSRHMPIRIREHVVRDIGLLAAIAQLQAIAHKNKKPHLSQRYADVTAILKEIQRTSTRIN